MGAKVTIVSILGGLLDILGRLASWAWDAGGKLLDGNHPTGFILFVGLGLGFFLGIGLRIIRFTAKKRRKITRRLWEAEDELRNAKGRALLLYPYWILQKLALLGLLIFAFFLVSFVLKLPSRNPAPPVSEKIELW